MYGCASRPVISPGQKAATHEVSERSERRADCWLGEVTDERRLFVYVPNWQHFFFVKRVEWQS